MQKRTLDTLKAGECGRVTGLSADAGLRRRFRDLGMINGTKIKCAGKSTHGDIAAYHIKGAVIAIRRDDAETVFIEDIANGTAL